jgi:RNA polymerase sigma factor (sigma-70 family)
MTVEATSTTPDSTANREEGAPVNDNPQVVNLVIGARKGDQQAWNALVERYSPLVWSICRRYRLSQSDTEDVFQTVWMRLAKQLDSLCDPAALGGWLSTTTRRECSRVWRANCRHQAVEQVHNFEDVPDHLTPTADHELLLAERNAALREAFTRLPLGCQRLLALLMVDPPVPYTEISSRLGISVGTIGPSRRRCLDRLRRDPAIAALLDPEARSASSNLAALMSTIGYLRPRHGRQRAVEERPGQLVPSSNSGWPRWGRPQDRLPESDTAAPKIGQNGLA